MHLNQEVSIMYCPRCGTLMQGGICPECGFPINRARKKKTLKKSITLFIGI